MIEKVHHLKIAPVYFEAVSEGRKTFEIRDCTDRDFMEGDVVILKEWDQHYTGRELSANIGYVSTFAQQPDYEVFSLLNVKQHGQ